MDDKRLKDESLFFLVHKKLHRSCIMAFQKGDPKPTGSGMKKGQKTKKTVWLRETLDSVKFNWEQELSNAYAEKDYKKIELLQQLIPYLNPKIKEKEVDHEDDSDNSAESSVSTDNILKITGNGEAK